jgi:hypothetical protein
LYLQSLFKPSDEEKRDVRNAFKQLHGKVENFELTMSQPSQFNRHSLGWAIEGLLSSDLLDDEKRAVLKDFKSNQAGFMKTGCPMPKVPSSLIKDASSMTNLRN